MYITYRAIQSEHCIGHIKNCSLSYALRMMDRNDLIFPLGTTRFGTIPRFDCELSTFSKGQGAKAENERLQFAIVSRGKLEAVSNE